MEIQNCPVCNNKLYNRYNGLVCKNWKCVLYHKLNTGWVFIHPHSNWSKQRVLINGFYKNSSRMFRIKKWVDKKQEILVRDNYTCQKCGYTTPTDQLLEANFDLYVHHIIYASEEMALYFDNDNLITLCNRCHTIIHSLDKTHFN